MLPGLIDDDPEFDKVWVPLRKDMRIVRLSYLPWSELIQPDAGIPTLVAHLNRQIEAHAPTGPILIAGYSFGGCLGYLCAVALQAAGRPAARLAVLDAPANTKVYVLPASKRLRYRIRAIRKFHFRRGLASVIAKIATRPALSALLRRAAPFRNAELPFGMREFLDTKLTMQMELRLFRPWWAEIQPPPEPFLTPTFIYRSADCDSFEDEDMGWGVLCRDCTVIRVPGDHGSMLHEGKNMFLLESLTKAMIGPL
jgi:thioesterase domain-containing protein